MTKIRSAGTAMLAPAGLMLLLGFSVGTAWAQTPQKETLSGGVTYTRVNASIACGGAIPIEALAELKKRGFVAVINLRQASESGANVEAEGEAAHAAGLKYIHMPFNYRSPDLPALVDSFLKAVIDPANLPVYIHSAEAHRVGGLWLIKRVELDGWSVDRAQAEAETIGLSQYSRPFALDWVKNHPTK